MRLVVIPFAAAIDPLLHLPFVIYESLLEDFKDARYSYREMRRELERWRSVGSTYSD